MKTNRKTLLLLLLALLLLLCGCGNETKEPNVPNEPENPVSQPSALFTDAQWDKLSGYWKDDDNNFVGFFKEDGKYCLIEGILFSDGVGSAEITSAKSEGELLSMNLYFPATEETEMQAASEAINVELTLDLSKTSENKLLLLLGDAWQTYVYGGDTLEELIAQ